MFALIYSHNNEQNSEQLNRVLYLSHIYLIDRHLQSSGRLSSSEV
jgi:hypothetical protein